MTDNGYISKEVVKLKDFIYFTGLIFPLSFVLFIYSKHIINSFFSGNFLVYGIFLFIIFSLISWVWSKLKIYSLFLLAVVHILGILSLLFLPESNSVQSNYGVLADIPATILAYFFLGSFYLIINFYLWLPFLLMFIWSNRKNLKEVFTHRVDFK